MFKRSAITFLACLAFNGLSAQNKTINSGPDSVVRIAHAAYDQVSGVHRWLFGENYRKEWAMPTKLPVLQLSTWHGGLTPVKQGGGMESRSLRLIDKLGREWVLRSVEKIPDKLLPENLQGTFAVDWVGDEFSGQHPYSALIVPPLADAAKVPHADPVIGIVADDPVLGEYRKIFTGMMCLLEEREPAGPSENTFKMEHNLIRSADDHLDGRLLLRARLLDLLLGDWDRHEDQWRWLPERTDTGKYYKAIPRDRDQVFHVTEGLFPSIAALPWIDPVLENFDGNIPRIKYSLYKNRFLRAFPDAQLSYDTYMRIVNEFVKAETDEVLESGLRRLPVESYRYRHLDLLAKLKKRRDAIPEAMDSYYRFINRIVDIHLTDDNEEVVVSDAPGRGLQIDVDRVNKNGKRKNTLRRMTYSADITREIRIYLAGGDDHVTLNAKNSAIRLRFVDSAGLKTYRIIAAHRRVPVYGSRDSLIVLGHSESLADKRSADTAATFFRPVNLYNIWAPRATAALNADDGFLLGLGFTYTGVDGFRKLPYTTKQQLLLTHAFATKAFNVDYKGEWIQVVGKADILLQANIQAPDNTSNFFGRGNDTKLLRTEGYRRYYRTRYDTYEVDPALRWGWGKGKFLTIGPSFQFYHMDFADNIGRFITNRSMVYGYDSSTVNKDKAHLGIRLTLTGERLNNRILPSDGYRYQVLVQAYEGLNNYSRSFFQVRPEFTWYRSLDPERKIVISDRVGGGISFGNPAFYQSMYLGGQGNLLGFLKNRFAGQHMAYNNLQCRIKLADIASYIIPGQLGISAFYDAGRVWVSGEHSDKWHQGTGGGVFFAPASLTVLQVLAGHSEEGWYPYISLNFRL